MREDKSIEDVGYRNYLLLQEYNSFSFQNVEEDQQKDGF